jgi:hydroxypyruvate isomerase
VPKFAANLTTLFTEFDFIDRFRAAAESGFTAVEYSFPYSYPKEQLAELLHKYGLRQVLQTLPAGNWEAGERGIACHPDRTGEFREGVELAIEYALTLDCKQLSCLPGLTPQTCPIATRETLIGNLRYAAARLGIHGIRLLIEPVNLYDNPNFFLNKSAHGLAVIDEVDHENLALLYDVYHMQMTEGNLSQTIGANLSCIGHIQIADVPGRNEPGTGEINFDYLFRFLDSIGYEGWIGCQYNPLYSTKEGLAWMSSYQLEPATR